MDPEIQTEAFTCRYCGSPTDVDPSDQTSRRLLPRIRSPLVVISSSLPPIRTTSPTTHPISYHLFSFSDPAGNTSATVLEQRG